ncbi:hypothetical protein KRZ98_16815 [Sphingobium sp. AS12]|uniref:hypothetical protein n=1 Tax=Sphingobium sp. AS12 TaxID=2849495 RepID=UPI001C31D27E|nr:hypothetical protein [Sphingobium sp. AS12]MBV2149908.1 hypothetical protein [Sphingobium sp. AS12]
MADATNVTVTLNVAVFDPPAMWDRALGIYAGVNFRYKIFDPGEPTLLAEELHDGFVAICGNRDEPDIGECVLLIFAGENPPGIQIDDSSAKIVTPAWDEKHLDRGEHGANGGDRD